MIDRKSNETADNADSRGWIRRKSASIGDKRVALQDIDTAALTAKLRGHRAVMELKRP
jgi:hypothetical protein